MSIALLSLAGDAGVSGDNLYTVALAALNVVQTIALAYLAASRVQQARKE